MEADPGPMKTLAGWLMVAGGIGGFLVAMGDPWKGLAVAVCAYVCGRGTLVLAEKKEAE